MSFPPNAPAVSAGKLNGLGSATNGRKATTSSHDVRLVPAVPDEPSGCPAPQFTAYAEMFHSMTLQAPALLRQLVEVMTLGTASYAATDAAGPDPGR